MCFPVSLYALIFVVVENWTFESNNMVILGIRLPVFPKAGCFLLLLFFLTALVFELRASCLLSRHSYHLSHSTSPVFVKGFSR
jgi:hypothetical protein